MSTKLEIEALIDAYKEAVYQKDLEAFAAIFDEEVRVFDLWEQWSYEGLGAWREMAKGWFSFLGTGRDVVTFKDIQIQVTGEMALASAFVRFTGVSAEGEELRYLEERLTWVAQKKAGAWKIVHQHTSAPVDFTTMKVILKK